tara:strand:- start:2051 stop:3595 length:1545 start_codon:yes stop_codon:yes gene_type:complete
VLYFSKLKIISVVIFSLLLTFIGFSNFFQNSLISKKINLGLDLQGGSYLLLEVDNKPVIQKNLQTKLIQLRNFFKEQRITTTNFSLEDQKIIFKVETKDIETVLKLFKENDEINPYYENYKSYQFNINQEKDFFIINYSKFGIVEINRSLLDQAVEIVRNRIDEVGTNEPTIAKNGSNRIIVELPGLDNPDRIKSLLGRTANLSFRFVTQNNDASFGIDKILTIDETEELDVSRRVIISGDNLVDAKPQMDNINNQTVVSFTLDRLGAKKFGKATKNGIGKRLAIVLDNKVISAPVIRDVIAGGSGQISGGFTFQSATDLALLLRSGALPAPLNIIEERTVGPDLGEDSIKAGILSLLIGFLLVVLYMFYKYRIFGLISNFALILNISLLIGVLTIFEATLTLPGIAGIILTVGMAVDANVLIFERIKEETLKEKNILIAFDSGYTNSKTTILDANITTIIAAIILFVFGSGPVKGFSVTLSIGILTTLFTVYFIARLLTAKYVILNKNKDILI